MLPVKFKQHKRKKETKKFSVQSVKKDHSSLNVYD